MASSKRWSSPSLPFELIEEILYRTPADSLIRFKSTCKQWYALIADKKFIYNHLHHSPVRFMRAVETVQIMDPVTGTCSVLPFPNEFPSQVSAPTMVHCDGLMLCMCDVGSRYVDLVIWNPVLRKTRWINPSHWFVKSDYYGIGYDNKSRDNYKILRLSYRRYDSPDRCYDGEPEAEIYEFKTDSWKTLDARVDWEIDIACKGVSVMGNMYWVAQKHQGFILGFDFSTKTFKDICFCPYSYDSVINSLLGCFSGHRLSLFQQDEESWQIDVWVTNKLGDGDVLFSKYFNVARPDLPELDFHKDFDHPVYSIGKDKSIMAWCEGPVQEDDKTYTCLTLYEIDQLGIRKQIETERRQEWPGLWSFLCGYVYVPSLIPLPG